MTPTGLDSKRGRFDSGSPANVFPTFGASSEEGMANLNLDIVDLQELLSSVASPSNPNPTKAPALQGRASAQSGKEANGYDSRLEEMGAAASARLKVQEERENFRLDKMDFALLNEFSFLLDVMDPKHPLTETERGSMGQESISKLKSISMMLNERDQKDK